MKLAIDIDGVLANFTDAYSLMLTKVSGIEFPRASKDWPTEWYWDRTLGITKEQERHVWGQIMAEGSHYWEKLQPLEEAYRCLRQLNWIAKNDHEVYFLTNRMGYRAKYQTERWLYKHGMDYPTVILSGQKTPLLRDMNIDFFIDDKPDTIYELYEVFTKYGWFTNQQFYLLDAPYNRRADLRYPGTKVALTLEEALRKAGLWMDTGSTSTSQTSTETSPTGASQ